MYKDIPYIAVIGSRGFNNYQIVERVLDKLKPFVLVSGGARGADSLAEEYADKNGLLKVIIKPDWERDGKKAGFIRNYKIVDKADIVVAFWDLESKGTKHSIDYSNKLNKPTYIYIVEVEK